MVDYGKWENFAHDLSDSDDESTKRSKERVKSKGKVTYEPTHWYAEEDFDAEYYSEDEDEEYRSKDVSYLTEQENALISEEMKRMSRNKEMYKHVAGKDFVLHLRFTCTRPAIWRQIRVPADITLDALHDKVLAPALGFARNYHSYLFITPKRPDKRVGFGRVDSSTVDSRNQRLLWGGEAMCDATQVLLYEAMPNKGCALRYVYDFFSRWRVSVILDHIEKRVDGKPPVEVLSGSRACPPEDSGPMRKYCEKLDTFLSDSHSERGDVMEEFNAALNVDPHGVGYKPAEWNQGSVQEALTDAWESAASPMDGSVTPRPPAFPTVPKGAAAETGKESVSTPTTAAKTTRAAKAAAAKAAAAKAGRGRPGGRWGITLVKERRAREAAARTCGNCEALIDKGKVLRCGRCRVMGYCNRDCQAKHWRKHKATCVAAPVRKKKSSGEAAAAAVASSSPEGQMQQQSVQVDKENQAGENKGGGNVTAAAAAGEKKKKTEEVAEEV